MTSEPGTVTSDNAESFGAFGKYRKVALSRISEFTMPPGTTYQTPEGLRAEDEDTRIAFDVQGGVYPIRDSVFRASYELVIPECRSCHHREHIGRVCNAGRGECQCEVPGMTSERAALIAAINDQADLRLSDGGLAIRRDHAVEVIKSVLAATPAPREAGWDELRREIEALPGSVSGDPATDGDYDSGWVNRAAVLAIVSRLAAARGEPGLDVERLAQVLDRYPMWWEVKRPGGKLVMTKMVGTAEAAAADIAAEYNRLATPTTPEPDPRRFRDYPDGHPGDVYRADCDCDCHIPGEDMDPADCDHCTGMSEQERAATPEPDPER